GDWSPFNLEIVSLMKNMFDTDKSGLTTFPEFARLRKCIEDRRTCFQAFDKDRSGFIDFNELKTAVTSFGNNLLDPFLLCKHAAGTGDVSFDNFVQIAVAVKSLT
ncbi:hypothetical protein BKA57DRAFT_384270, partial [Linnemannia elongata]